VIDGLKYPQADGTAGQFLKTDGSGQLAFATVGSSIPSGTKMLFAQTAAPTGFTKDTSNNNNSAIRIVTGTAGTGGSVDFTTAFATPSVSGSIGLSGDLAAGNLAVSMSGNISDTTLTTSQIPAHTHTIQAANQGNGNHIVYNDGSGLTTKTTSSTGGGGAHNHAHNLSGTLSGTPGVGNLAGSLSSATATINVKYVDVIVATKD
jgi:microcystin-dependent protein